MAQNTPIEWADKSWNPIRGCSRVSEGCRNCYAERVAARFSGKGMPYEGLAEFKIIGGEKEPHWTGKVSLVEKDLDAPLRWRAGIVDKITGKKRPLRIFVNSMSDLFHEQVPDEWIDRIFAVMALAKNHNFLILTKRPKRMLKYLTSSNIVQPGPDAELERRDDIVQHTLHIAHQIGKNGLMRFIEEEALIQKDRWPLPNVWLGVSVEDQKTADERIPLLLRTPAAVRFVSYEPALGPVSFRWNHWVNWGKYHPRKLNAGSTNEHDGLRMLDWMICGGESGPHARPMHPDWARTVRDQCHAASLPFFFKQWGEWCPWEPMHPARNARHMSSTTAKHGDAPGYVDGSYKAEVTQPIVKVGKKKSGRLLDGREHNEFPQTKP